MQTFNSKDSGAVKMNNKKAFTLVEVLLATVIMVSVLGALVYGLGQSSDLIQTSRNQDIALNAAQEKLEEIANSNLSQIMSYNNAPLNSFSVQDAGGNDLLFFGASTAPGQVTVTPVAGTNNLFDVEVTVTWQQSGGREIERVLTTTLVQK